MTTSRCVNGRKKLGQIWREMDDLPWNAEVYFPSGQLSVFTQCLVLREDLDELDPDEDVPRAARDAGMSVSLAIADLRSIRNNLRLQQREPDDALLVEALEYYLDNDAFIELDSHRG